VLLESLRHVQAVSLQTVCPHVGTIKLTISPADCSES
jgi:hypothetical protein